MVAARRDKPLAARFGRAYRVAFASAGISCRGGYTPDVQLTADRLMPPLPSTHENQRGGRSRMGLSGGLPSSLSTTELPGNHVGWGCDGLRPTALDREPRPKAVRHTPPPAYSCSALWLAASGLAERRRSLHYLPAPDIRNIERSERRSAAQRFSRSSPPKKETALSEGQ